MNNYRTKDERRRTKRMRELADSLGVTLELAEIGLLKARQDTFKALRHNEGLKSYLGRN